MNIYAKSLSVILLLHVIASFTFADELARETSTPNSTSSFNSDETKILIQNAAMLLSMDPDLGEGPLGILEGADLLINKGKIVEVGKNITASDALILDAQGKIVMPGFVDVHNHLWQSIIRGCGADTDIAWLKQCLDPVRQVDLTRKEAYSAVTLSLTDLLNTGVTTVVDDSHDFNKEFAEGNLEALVDSGIRFVYAYCGRKKSFEHMRQVKTKVIDPNPLASFQICAHPTINNIQWLKDVAKLARELNVTVNLHLAESIDQKNEQQMKAMERAGLFGNKLLLNHSIHLSDDDIAILSRNDARVAYNPASNMRIASGIFRYSAMKKSGVKIGLGLDGGVNDSSDFFYNMKVAVGLQRANTLDAETSPTIEEVLRVATLGGAEVLGMEDKIGSLIPGKSADVLIIDPNNVHFAPKFNWLSQLVFNGRPGDVEYVFVRGQALKVKGKVLANVDEQKLIREVQLASDRVQEYINGRSPE